MNAKWKTRELEFKLTLEDPEDAERIVSSLASMRYEIASGPVIHNEDLYLDTFEWTLLKRGVVLRFRRVDERQFYTVTSVGTMKGGMADRVELEVPVRREIQDPTIVPVKRVRSRVDPVIWPRRLIEQVMVRTERRTYRLTRGSDVRVELAFDTTRFQVRGLNVKHRASRLYEMEAELVKGGAEEFAEISRHVTERFACRPSAKSRLETAMDRLKIAVPSKKPPKKLAVRRDDRLDLATRKILAFQFQRFHEYLPGVHLDIDTEFVHQARVATRRMRSALRLFQGALPEKTAEYLRAELGWIASQFGEVRDLDVFLLKLPDVCARIESSSARQHQVLERWVAEHRAGSLDTLGSALHSNRFRAFESRLRTFLATPLPKRPRAPLALKTVGETAPGIILEKQGAVIKQGRKVVQKPELRDFHKLRIQTKRLRYACEFVAPAYGEYLQPFIDRTVNIQDCLGALQDTVFTRAFIERIMADWKGMAVNPDVLFLLGEIYQLQGEIARAKQVAFAELWRDFDRREVDDELRAILGGKRDESKQAATGESTLQEEPASSALIPIDAGISRGGKRVEP